MSDSVLSVFSLSEMSKEIYGNLDTSFAEISFLLFCKQYYPQFYEEVSEGFISRLRNFSIPTGDYLQGPYSMLEKAIGLNCKEVIIWANENGLLLADPGLTSYAAEIDNREMFDLLINLGVPEPRYNFCCWRAVRDDKLNALKWLTELGYSERDLCKTAAELGRLEILKWLIKNENGTYCMDLETLKTSTFPEVNAYLDTL
jgi:hypothetical protein